MRLPKASWVAQKLLNLPSNRIFDKVLKNIIRSENFTSLRGRNGCFWTLGPSDDSDLKLVRSLVVIGRYEESFINLLLKLVTPGDSFIDVGANEGYFSVPIAIKVGDSGHVFACEPHPKNIKTLNENIKLNNIANITTIQKALGDSKGKVDFFGDRAWGTLLKTDSVSGLVQLSVDVDTIDNIVSDALYQSLRLIKIDAEGNDLQVIRGAQNTIASARPIVAFEVNLTLLAYVDISIEETFSFFKENDYGMYIEKKGKLEQFDWLSERICNLVAIPSERLAEDKISQLLV